MIHTILSSIILLTIPSLSMISAFCSQGMHPSFCKPKLLRYPEKVPLCTGDLVVPRGRARVIYASGDDDSAGGSPKAKRSKSNKKPKTSSKSKAKVKAKVKSEPERERISPKAESATDYLDLTNANQEMMSISATENASGSKASPSEDEEEDELYSILYGDQSLVAEEDIDYAKLDRDRMAAEDAAYANYEYFNETMVDDDGVEIGWDPVFGPSNPIDSRAILSKIDSYMVADHTRDDSMLIAMTPLDEEEFNDEISRIQRERRKLETYRDPYLNVDVPRYAKPWYGEWNMDENPYSEKDWMNNRFTKLEDKSDVKNMTAYNARKHAVFLARSNNNEWLPEGYAQNRLSQTTQLFQERNILAGSLKRGDVDPTLLTELEPVLKKIGGVVEILSIEDGVYRFHYRGPMKHRKGIQNWTDMMMKDLGIRFTGVFFETGVRKVDPRDNVFRGFACYGRVSS